MRKIKHFISNLSLNTKLSIGCFLLLLSLYFVTGAAEAIGMWLLTR